MFIHWKSKQAVALQESHTPESVPKQGYTELGARPTQLKPSCLSSSLVAIVISCVLSTIIGFIIASSSQRLDLNLLLKDLRLKYEQLFGYHKETHFKNALIVSLLDQSHHELALKKNFNVITASTQLERREKKELGTNGRFKIFGNLPDSLGEASLLFMFPQLPETQD